MSRKKRKGGKRKFGFFTRVVHFVLITLSILLGIVFAAGYFIGEDMPLLGWLFEFPMLFFAVGLFLLAVIFAATGLRLWVLLPLVEVAFCVMMLQPRFNSFKPVPEGIKTLTVMSYNVEQFHRGREKVMDVVRKISPDILLIQEFKGGSETAESFCDKLFPDGSFALISRTAVFSKYPLKKNEGIEIYEGRSIQKLVVEIGDKEVTLCNVHFPVVVPLNRYHLKIYGIFGEALKKQRSGREKLLEIIDEITGPIVVSGDFNAAPHTMLIRMIQERLQDSFLVSGAGLGHTFDSKLPLIRIDYIFLSNEFSVYSHEVLDEKASDHRPIVVIVSLDESK